MAALPPLRSDLIIEAVAPAGGEPAYDLSSPDLSRVHRVTSQAYLALSMIDGRKDFAGWVQGVQHMYPELGAGQLWALAAQIQALGYFSSPANLPPQPGPPEGPPLIRDLAADSGAETGLPEIPAFDLGGMTDPAAPALSDVQSAGEFLAGADFSPEAAMDQMFAADPPGASPSPEVGSPAPVTAVNAPNPLAGQGGAVALPGADGPGDDDSDDLDLDVAFPEGPDQPLAPAQGSASEMWTAPSTPAPGNALSPVALPGGSSPPADAGPPPLPSSGRAGSPPAGPGPMPTPATNPDVTDPGLPSALEGPAVASLPSGEGHGDVPKAYGNLVVEPAENGLVAVTGPVKGIPFQIYELEHRMLELLDGSKDLDQLLDEIRMMGHPVDKGQLQSFLRQMDAYGFLESTGPLTRTVDAQRMWSPAPPDPGLPRSAWPEEERRLFQVGLGHFRDGRRDRAESFFEALLEINPENPEARSMLDLLRGPEPTFSPDDLDAPRGVSGSQPPAPGPAKKRRPLMWATLLVLLLAGAAAGGGMAVEQPFSITEPARVLAGGGEPIKAPADGEVAEVLVEAGEQVKAGAPLVRFATEADPAKLQAALDEAQARLAALEAVGDDDERDLKRDQKKAERRIAYFQKKIAKYEKRAAKARGRRAKRAERKVEEYEADLAKDQARLQRAEAGLAALAAGQSEDEVRARIDELKAAVEEAQEARAGAVLKAEADGVVALAGAGLKAGDKVKAGQPLFVLGQGGQTIEVLIGQETLKLVEPGATFSFRSVAFPDQDVKTEVLSVAERVVEVEGRPVIKVTGRPLGEIELKPEMTGRAEFVGQPMPLTLIVTERLRRWAQERSLL